MLFTAKKKVTNHQKTTMIRYQCSGGGRLAGNRTFSEVVGYVVVSCFWHIMGIGGSNRYSMDMHNN